jgi:hypothetical protein
MNRLTKLTLLLATVIPAVAHAAEPCQTFHGRARYYPGDGQLRIWRIGTHHTFMPSDREDQDFGVDGWDKVIALINRGNPHPNLPAEQQVFATFTVCPIEPLTKGASQRAAVTAIHHAVTVPWTN